MKGPTSEKRPKVPSLMWSLFGGVTVVEKKQTLCYSITNLQKFCRVLAQVTYKTMRIHTHIYLIINHGFEKPSREIGCLAIIQRGLTILYHSCLYCQMVVEYCYYLRGKICPALVNGYCSRGLLQKYTPQEVYFCSVSACFKQIVVVER